MRFHGFLSPTLLLARTNHTSATTTHTKIYLAHSSWHSYWMCVLLLFHFEFQSKYQNCIIQKVWKYESSLRPEQTRFRLIWCCRYRFNRINFTHKKNRNSWSYSYMNHENSHDVTFSLYFISMLLLYFPLCSNEKETHSLFTNRKKRILNVIA